MMDTLVTRSPGRSWEEAAHTPSPFPRKLSQLTVFVFRIKGMIPVREMGGSVIVHYSCCEAALQSPACKTC